MNVFGALSRVITTLDFDWRHRFLRFKWSISATVHSDIVISKLTESSTIKDRKCTETNINFIISKRKQVCLLCIKYQFGFPKTFRKRAALSRHVLI